ncbi:MAG: 2-oxoacid:acceptor oxidoreductase family protein [Promethearchaeota archaeon]
MSTKAKEFNLLNCGVGGQGVIRASQILAWSALLDGYDVRTAETHGMAQRGGSVASYIRFGSKVTGPLIPRGNVDILLAFEASEALRNLEYGGPKTRFFVSDNTQIPPVVLTSRTVTVDYDRCVGCGNCLAFCQPYYISKRKDKPYTYVPVGKPAIKNGHRDMLAACTGCGECISQHVCPNYALRLEMDFTYPTVDEIRENLLRVSEHVHVISALDMAGELGNPRVANVIMLGVILGSGFLPIDRDTLERSVLQFVPPKARDVNKKAFQVGIDKGRKFAK